MYLNLLKENEKELFICLAYDLASADGNYSDEEGVISNYIAFQDKINQLVLG